MKRGKKKKVGKVKKNLGRKLEKKKRKIAIFRATFTTGCKLGEVVARPKNVHTRFFHRD